MSEDDDRAEVPPDRFTALWRRLKDHRIAQWTVGYVAVAYGIQHAVTLTSEALKWPDAVLRISILVLALGLPVAMTLAWYHGDRTARRISSGELAVVSVVLLGISFAFYLFVRPSGEAASAGGAASRAGIASPASPAAPTGASLAVLPFANVSGDPNQEYFSDGMTDEIMTALAKIPDLRVVARESAFTFKGKSGDVRAIGRDLGARYLVEGSVRKAGDRVRITAQLVRADNGVSLWTEGYDRELKDIFATQEDVARAIAASLQVPLGLQQGERLISNRAVDPESYQQYLRAKALVRTRGTGIAQAISILEPVVVHDPDYSPAWALLALAYELTPNYTRAIYTPALRSGNVEGIRRVIQSTYDKAERAAREAIRLDSRSAVSYEVLARNTMHRNASGQWAAAEDLFRQALALDPGDPEVLEGYSLYLAFAGRLKDSLSLREKLRALEPFVPAFNEQTAMIMATAGQIAAAISIMEAAPARGVGGDYALAAAYAAEGRYAQAADMLLLHTANTEQQQSAEVAARLLRSAPAKASEPLPDLERANFVYAYVGAPQRIMDYPERQLRLGLPFDTTVIDSLWNPHYASARKSERIKTYVRNAGLLDYWRARGWPDLCHPTTGDDFECN